MSVLRVLYSFPLRLGISGIGMTAWYQVTGLLGQGVKVHVYAGSCEKELVDATSLHETLVFSGVKLPITLLGTRRAAALHDRIVARNLPQIHEKDRIDIVHCWPSGALATLITARKLGIKTMLERPSAHTGYVFKVTEDECRKLGLKLGCSHYAAFNKKKLDHEEREFAAADRLLCPSEFVVKTFLEKGFQKERLLRHQYGYDPEFFSPGKRSGDENKEHLFTMVYVGECNPLKGLHFALKAWGASEASEKGRFYICGSFLPEYHDLLTPLLANPGVKHLGFVRDVARIMRQCDVLVLPSLAEGFGIVTCEARACGCVILVSDASTEACEHMKNGLVHKAGDVDTLRQHIDLLASDKDLRNRLRANSLANASRFTWSEAAKSLMSAYRKCLNENKNP